jgi:hypothetical protein
VRAVLRECCCSVLRLERSRVRVLEERRAAVRAACWLLVRLSELLVWSEAAGCWCGLESGAARVGAERLVREGAAVGVRKLACWWSEAAGCPEQGDESLAAGCCP